jgi:hypothetical protein
MDTRKLVFSIIFMFCGVSMAMYSSFRSMLVLIATKVSGRVSSYVT